MRLDLEAKRVLQPAKSSCDWYRTNPKGNLVNDPGELLDRPAQMTSSCLFQGLVVIQMFPKMILDHSTSESTITAEYRKGHQFLLRKVTTISSKATGCSRNL